jgi:hypothetical protein
VNRTVFAKAPAVTAASNEFRIAVMVQVEDESAVTTAAMHVHRGPVLTHVVADIVSVNLNHLGSGVSAGVGAGWAVSALNSEAQSR